MAEEESKYSDVNIQLDIEVADLIAKLYLKHPASINKYKEWRAKDEPFDPEEFCKVLGSCIVNDAAVDAIGAMIAKKEVEDEWGK